MLQRSAIATATFACVLASANIAAADQLPMFPTVAPVNLGSFYVSVGSTVQRTEVGRFNSSFTEFATQSPFISATPKVTAAGPAVTAGYVTDWQGFGGRPRVEGFFSFVYGRSSITTTTPFGPGFSAVRLDGGNVFLGSGVDSASANTLSTTYHAGEGGLRVKTDLAILPNLALTPGLGVLVGNVQQKAQFSYYQLGATLTGLHTSEEFLETWRFGGEASLDLTWVATPELSFNGGVSGAIFYQNTKLTGVDCGSNSLISPICDGNLNGTGAFRSAIEVSRNKIGGRLGFSAGGTYKLGFVNISLAGSAAWNLNTPGIRNPTLNDRAPASIRYDNTWSFGGFAMVTIPFGPR